jgi:hypothetical protein
MLLILFAAFNQIALTPKDALYYAKQQVTILLCLLFLTYLYTTNIPEGYDRNSDAFALSCDFS